VELKRWKKREGVVTLLSNHLTSAGIAHKKWRRIRYPERERKGGGGDGKNPRERGKDASSSKGLAADAESALTCHVEKPCGDLSNKREIKRIRRKKRKKLCFSSDLRDRKDILVIEAREKFGSASKLGRSGLRIYSANGGKKGASQKNFWAKRESTRRSVPVGSKAIPGRRRARKISKLDSGRRKEFPRLPSWRETRPAPQIASAAIWGEEKKEMVAAFQEIPAEWVGRIPN